MTPSTRDTSGPDASAARTRTHHATAPGETVTVTTSLGAVRGLREGGVDSFLAIPFAAPPTGVMRFRPPRPPEPWSGVRDCTRPGPTGSQPRLPEGLMPQTIIDGDDMLHLNVHTPGLDGERPVLVWIHGGGMVMGGNADVDGRALARRGLVVVAVNYRLGCDGFLCLDDAPPNRAVHDWIAALEWVRAEIARFGGDPADVTIGGHSAGSAACLTLLAAPRAESLFGRVVAMSGVPWNLVDLDTARARARELAGRVDAPPTVAGIGAVPLDRLIAVQTEMAPVGGIGTATDPLELFRNIATLDAWMGPVIDGDVVPDDPARAVAAGAGPGAEVMIGSTAQEMDALLAFFGGSLTSAAAADALAGIGLDRGTVERWLASEPERTPGQALGAALTALSFRIPALVLASGRGATGAAPTYVYETAWRPPTPLGAVHGCDVAFAFDTIDDPQVAMVAGGPPPASLADDIAGAISRFVSTGDPGWPAYRPDARREMAFDVPSRVRADPDPLTRTLFSPLR